MPAEKYFLELMVTHKQLSMETPSAINGDTISYQWRHKQLSMETQTAHLMLSKISLHVIIMWTSHSNNEQWDTVGMSGKIAKEATKTSSKSAYTVPSKKRKCFTGPESQ